MTNNLIFRKKNQACKVLVLFVSVVETGRVFPHDSVLQWTVMVIVVYTHCHLVDVLDTN